MLFKTIFDNISGISRDEISTQSMLKLNNELLIQILIG
jgi:hypothetical protein